MKVHLSKDFWNHIVFFVSKDENLTKAHIRYLQRLLIEQATAVGRASVINTKSSGSKLPESDREDMEVYLEEIHQLLTVIGVEVLVPLTTSVSASGKADVMMLYCETKGVKGMGYRIPNGMVVLPGSQVVLKEHPSAVKYPWPVNLRTQLKGQGTLKEAGTHLEFVQDYEFACPSAAAAVIHGGTTNGLTAWRNKDGKQLKELESA